MTTATRISVPPRPMATTTESLIPTGPERSPVPAPEQVPPRKTRVAALSTTRIRQMDCGELITLIHVVDLPLPDECLCRLEFQDHRTLELLAFRAQRAVRNQGY